jgi:hypothetical protein
MRFRSSLAELLALPPLDALDAQARAAVAAILSAPPAADLDALEAQARAAVAAILSAPPAVDLDAMVADLSVALRYESLDT